MTSTASRRWRGYFAATLMASLIGCGSSADVLVTAPGEARPTCTVKLDGETVPADQLQAAHALYRQQAIELGKKVGAAWVERRTKDGYALRGFVSTSIMALACLLGGALLATVLLGFFRKRPAVQYAQLLGKRLDSELERLRKKGDKDTLTADLLARLATALGEAERRGERWIDECVPLQESTDTVTMQGRLDSLYARIERLIAQIERTQLRVDAWQEQLAKADDKVIQAAVDRAISDLDAAIAEAGT